MLEEPAHVGEGARAFTHCLAHGPEPRGVNVGVAGRDHGHRGGIGGLVEFATQHLAGVAGGRVQIIRVGDVECIVEAAEDVLAARAVLGEFMHEAVQRNDILFELPDRCRAPREAKFREVVNRVVSRALPLTELRRRECPVTCDVGIGGKFEVVLEARGAGFEREVLVVGIDRLDGGAVGIPDERLGLEARHVREGEIELEFYVTFVVGHPRVGDLARHVQPQG